MFWREWTSRWPVMWRELTANSRYDIYSVVILSLARSNDVQNGPYRPHWKYRQTARKKERKKERLYILPVSNRAVYTTSLLPGKCERGDVIARWETAIKFGLFVVVHNLYGQTDPIVPECYRIPYSRLLYCVAQRAEWDWQVGKRTKIVSEWECSDRGFLTRTLSDRNWHIVCVFNMRFLLHINHVMMYEM